MDDEQRADIDRSDVVRHGSEEARAEAAKKLQDAIARKKSEESKSKILRVPPVQNQKLLEKLKKDTKNVLTQVKIYSPFHTYYEGQANSVSAINQTGPFDILPGHKNFMTLLTRCEVVVRNRQGEERIQIDRGVMRVRQDKVTIFLDV